MNKKKLTVIAGVVVFAALLASLFLLWSIPQQYYQEAEQLKSFQNLQATFGITHSLPVTETRTYPFLLQRAGSVPFALWSKALTGSARLSIIDSSNGAVKSWQGRIIDEMATIDLPPGAYIIELTFTRYIGSARFGLSEVQFITNLPEEHYRTVQANPTAGFHWGYLLYTPETVLHPYLLVAPNNTGYEDDDMRFHEEAAKEDVLSLSELANQLGTPLLVPIFPRPSGELEGYYTHNLDRNVLLMDLENYQRIDLQLLAMVEDARLKLAKEQLQIEPRFLLWGFSASGTFADRFSLLHPDRLVAVAAGACTHALPFATFSDENLPYPVGTFDYASINGAPFDADAFAALPRYLYKGDLDAGGTMTVETGVYPASEYFDLFVREELEARLETAPTPLITGEVMSQADEDLLRYRIYQGAVFVEEFRAVSSIFSDAGLTASQFKLYPGVEHEYTEEMSADVLAFFKANIP